MKKLLFFIIPTIAVTPCIAQQTADTINELDIYYYHLNPSINQISQYKNKQVIAIDSNYLKAVNAQNVDQVLRSVAGIDVRQRGASGVQSDIGMDGGTFDQTMLLVNGLKLTDAQTGHNMMMLPFETSMLQEVQIIKGAASSMYGVNALAGSINLLTRTPNRPYLEAQLTAGSAFNKKESGQPMYHNQGMHISGGTKLGSFFHQVHGGWKASNGYRKNTVYQSPNIWYQAEGYIGRHHVQLMAGYRYMDFGANGFYAAPGDSNSQETVQNTIAGLRHQVPVRANLIWQNDVAYVYKTDDYKYIKQPVIGRNVHYQNSLNYTTALKWRTKYGNFKIGAEWRNEWLNSTNLGLHERWNLGGILNYDLLIKQKFSLEAGLYVNHNSQYKTQVYPNIGLGYYLSTEAKIIANIGTGQRLPTFTDLYYKQRGVIEGNDQLKAEQAINMELGFQYKTHQYQLATYVFHRSIDQFIDWTRASIADVWRPNNYHQLNTLGYHLSWQHNATANDKWEYGYILSYNYLSPSIQLHNDQIISRYAINALRHHAVGGVYAEWNNALKLTLGYAYHERISYKSYGLWNASIQYQYQRLLLGLNVQNLTDNVVVEAGANPLPGRWIQAQVKLRIF